MDQGEHTDGDLIRGSIDDPQMFEGIFERHYDRVFRYMVRRVGRTEGADLTVEVFVAAFEQRGRFWIERESALPWLFGIASNLAKRYTRSLDRRRRAFLRAAGVSSDLGDEGAVAERVDAASLVAQLNTALGRLRSQDREVVLLIVLGDLTYQETAAALGLPIGTVRSTFSRAKARLRSDLGDVGWNPNDDFGQGVVR